MPVIDFLERNVKLYGNEVALVELNPEIPENRRMTWKEYDLIQPTSDQPYRREITWNVFDEKANRFAAASCALKHSVEGDFQIISRAEVERLCEQENSRIER